MNEERKPSAAAIRAAEKLSEFIREYQDLSEENAILPPYDGMAFMIDAEFAPVVEALRDTLSALQSIQAACALSGMPPKMWAGFGGKGIKALAALEGK